MSCVVYKNSSRGQSDRKKRGHRWTAFFRRSSCSAGTIIATTTTAGSTSRCTWSARSSFLCAYALDLQDPAAAALIGWLVAMTSRQVGHFFFEPKDYDEVNQATHEHKEEIKVGYNLQAQGRAAVDLGAVAAAAVARSDAVRHVPAAHRRQRIPAPRGADLAGRSGSAALLFRTVQLFFIKDVQTGLVWVTKILTDPFHDIKLYYRAPLYLLRGELIDPMTPIDAWVKSRSRLGSRYRGDRERATSAARSSPAGSRA